MGILLCLFEYFYEKHTSLSDRDFGGLTGQNLVAYSVLVSRVNLCIMQRIFCIFDADIPSNTRNVDGRKVCKRVFN